MKFWRKRSNAEGPSFEELRRPIRWCEGCRSPIAPFIYFQNGKHYCYRCAERVWATMGLRSAGKRTDDIQYPPAG